MNKYEYYAKQISNMLSCPDCFEFYGFKLDHSGYICCPFHSEKTASLKVWKDHWKCFGCGEHGDCISLVQKMFNLSFPGAIKKLNEDFNLGIITGKPQYSSFRKFKTKVKKTQRERRQSEVLRQKDLDDYYHLEKIESELHHLILSRKPNPEDETCDYIWLEAVQTLPYIRYILDNFETEGGPPG